MTAILGYHQSRLMDAEDLTIFADEPRIVVHLPLGFEENVYEVYGRGLSDSDACEAVTEVLRATYPEFTSDWNALEEAMYT